MYGTERERRWAAVYAHRERLLRVARARLADANDAEDCVQEAMLRCVEFTDLDEERLGQFLTSVTVRLCADVHRGRARGDRLRTRLTSYLATEPGPEEDVCDRAESAWLSRFLDALTPRQRAIVEARAEGLSCVAVAERVAVSSTAVESSMARVRRSLRVALESTLGVASDPLRWVREHPAAVAAGALSVSAAFTAGYAPGELSPRTPAAVVAIPHGPAGVATGAAGRTVGAHPAGRVTVASGIAGVRAVVGTVAANVRQATGQDHPVVAASVGGLDAGASQHPDGQSEQDRLENCIDNGVGVGEYVRCRRYPAGDPRNGPEELGTPPLPVAQEG